MKKEYNREISTGEALAIAEKDMANVVIWPDDVWCFVEDLDEYLTHKSDDYIIKEVDLSLTEDGIDEFVYNYNRESVTA